MQRATCVARSSTQLGILDISNSAGIPATHSDNLVACCSTLIMGAGDSLWEKGNGGIWPAFLLDFSNWENVDECRVWIYYLTIMNSHFSDYVSKCCTDDKIEEEILMYYRLKIVL